MPTLTAPSSFRVETQDGGDAKAEASPRDIVYMQSAEPADDEEPDVLHKLDAMEQLPWPFVTDAMETHKWHWAQIHSEWSRPALFSWTKFAWRMINKRECCFMGSSNHRS